MTYRDRPISCPRCQLELARGDSGDHWRCGKCHGVLLGTGELVRVLLVVAPDLVPAGEGVHGITTLGRRSPTTLPCGVCGAPMEPVFLGGIGVDRCYHDELVWFDGGELDLVLTVAHEQHGERTKSWLARMMARLF